MQECTNSNYNLFDCLWPLTMLLGSPPARVLLASNGEIRLLTINGTDIDPAYHVQATSVKGLDYNHLNNSFCYVSHFSSTRVLACRRWQLSSPSLRVRSARVMHSGLFVGLSVCLSGRATQKLSLRFTWFFYTRSVIPVPRASSNMIWIWTRTDVFKDPSPLGDRTKYAMKVRHSVKDPLWWKHYRITWAS